jgi:NAD(P)-dependent dehydrogenase (short-subunit alcohol dehydrogenase family)
MSSDLTGRTAWVTGGSGGIGTAIVAQLTEASATVAILDLQPPVAGSPCATWRRCDVGDAHSVAEESQRLEREVGPADILINCAGVAASAPVHQMTDELWHSVIATNLTGAFHMSRRVLGGMIERKWGRIVSISSGSAVRAGPGTAAYSASKAGLIGFSRALAHDGAQAGVTANVVAPGIVDTPMTRRAWPAEGQMAEMVRSSPIANPMGALLMPDDIAAAVVFLASEEARFITGQTIHVNGGSTML